jgi:hypothetical protein
MIIRCKFGTVLALGLALGLACVPVSAQQFRTVAQTPMQQRRMERQLRRQQQLNGMRRGNPNNPMPRVVERLQDMPPERQEKFLENNQRFQNLPPQQQAVIRRRLQAWNRLTPGQQQEFRARQLVWEQMTPQQQQEVRQNLLPRWQQLPPKQKSTSPCSNRSAASSWWRASRTWFQRSLGVPSSAGSAWISTGCNKGAARSAASASTGAKDAHISAARSVRLCSI